MDYQIIPMILGPLLGVVIGSYFTYFFTRRSMQQEAVFRNKEKKYANLLVYLAGFPRGESDMEPFFRENYRTWLFGSDSVIRAINDFIEYMKKMPPEDEEGIIGKEKIGKIVHAMRVDLLGKTSLEPSDFTYTIFRWRESRK